MHTTLRGYLWLGQEVEGKLTLTIPPDHMPTLTLKFGQEISLFAVIDTGITTKQIFHLKKITLPAAFTYCGAEGRSYCILKGKTYELLSLKPVTAGSFGKSA